MVRGRRRQHLLLADENLISFVGQGDAEAFTTLYDRRSRAAFSLAYRVMGERQAAEDLGAGRLPQTLALGHEL